MLPCNVTYVDKRKADNAHCKTCQEVAGVYLDFHKSLLEERDEVLHGLQQQLRLRHIMHFHEEEAQLLQGPAHPLILCLCAPTSVTLLRSA